MTEQDEARYLSIFREGGKVIAVAVVLGVIAAHWAERAIMWAADAAAWVLLVKMLMAGVDWVLQWVP